MKSPSKRTGIIALAALVITMTIIVAVSCSNGTTSGPSGPFTVTYHANGETITVPASQTVAAGSAIIVAALQGYDPATAEKTFNGWNTRADAGGTFYSVGYSLAVNRNMDLYAIWSGDGSVDEAVEYPVTLQNYQVTEGGHLWEDICFPEWLSNRRIENGQSYSVSFTFKANVSFQTLLIYLADASAASATKVMSTGFSQLTTFYDPVAKEYSGTVSLASSGTTPNNSMLANCLRLVALTNVNTKPVLTFTELSIWKNEPVALTGVTANGSTGNKTSEIYLRFSDDVTINSWANVRLKSDYIYDILIRQPLESALSGSGTSWVLDIDVQKDDIASFEIEVSVIQSGLTITGNPKKVTIYTGSNVAPPLPKVNFFRCTANGSDSVRTTELTLSFNNEITGLAAGDITLSGIPGIAKGTLSGPFTAANGYDVYYTLPVSGFTIGGSLTVNVAKSGWNITKTSMTNQVTPTIYADYSSHEYKGLLGRGYDVINSPYYVASEVKTASAINMPKAIGLQKYQRNEEVIVEAVAQMVTGETLEKHQRDLSVKAGASGGIGLFSASVNVKYQTSTKTSEYRSFSTLSAEIIRETQWLDLYNLDEIRDNYLTPQFKNDLASSMDPETLFDMYGTHIIAKVYLGGRLDMSYSYVNKSRESSTAIETKVKARYGAVSAGVDTDSRSLSEIFGEETTEVIAAYGGDPNLNITSFQSALSNYNQWAAGISSSEYLNIVNCGSLDNYWEMIPIWYLCANNAAGSLRSTQIANRYQTLYNTKATWIKGLQDSVQNEYLYTLGVAAVNSSFDVAKAHVIAMLAPSPATVLECDLNKGAGGQKIALGYSMTSGAAGAITDIRAYSGKTYPTTAHVNTVPYPHHLSLNLNSGVSGSHITLFFTRESGAGKPIKTLYVEVDGDVSGITSEPWLEWQRIQWVSNSGVGANMNQGTKKGSEIYIWMGR